MTASLPSPRHTHFQIKSFDADVVLRAESSICISKQNIYENTKTKLKYEKKAREDKK